MKATSIHARNLKGANFTKQLAPITIITGPIGSGKTSIADALRLALLGYIPALGKRASDSFDLCGAKAPVTTMDVSLDFDIGAQIERRFFALRGSVKTETDAKGIALDFAPPVMLDVQTYFGMTGAERLRYVFGQMDLSKHGLTPDDIKASIRGLRPDPSMPESEAAITALLEKADAIAEEDLDQSVQDWLAKFLDHIKATKTATDAELKRMTGAMQAGTQLASGDAHLRPLPVISAELAAARKLDATLTEAIGKLRYDNQQREADAKRRSGLVASLVALPEDDGERLAGLVQSIAELDARLAGYVSATNELRTASQKTTNAAVEAKTKLAGLTREIANLKAEDAKLADAKCCPTCKSKGKNWRDSYQEFLEERLGALTAESEALAAELLALEKQRALQSEAIAAAVARDNAIGQHRDTRDGLIAAKTKLAHGDVTRQMLTQQLAACPAATQMEDPTPLLARQSEVKASIAKLDTERLRAAGAQQDALRREQAKAQQLASEAAREVLKLATVALTEIQQRLVDAAYSGIVGKVNRFTVGILPATLEYRDGELGYVRGATWVSHRTFSGSEQMVTYAGLCVALCQSSPYKLVILDELGRMGPGDKATLLVNMASLIADGSVDQCVLLDVATKDWQLAALGYPSETVQQIICAR